MAASAPTTEHGIADAKMWTRIPTQQWPRRVTARARRRKAEDGAQLVVTFRKDVLSLKKAAAA